MISIFRETDFILCEESLPTSYCRCKCVQFHAATVVRHINVCLYSTGMCSGYSKVKHITYGASPYRQGCPFSGLAFRGFRMMVCNQSGTFHNCVQQLLILSECVCLCPHVLSEVGLLAWRCRHRPVLCMEHVFLTPDFPLAVTVRAQQRGNRLGGDWYLAVICQRPNTLHP